MSGTFVLGTAQLGTSYGINNKVGRHDHKQARDLVLCAFEWGVNEFDTAQAYGESEAVLGQALGELGLESKVSLFSKIHPDVNVRVPLEVERSVAASLKHLKVDRLAGLMLHREKTLVHWEDGLRRTMRGLVDRGLAASIGVSFFTPEAALEALDMDGIDFIQIPASIFDRRFEKAGVIEKAGRQGKRVFIRSIFVQGLLLMGPTEVPARLAFAAQHVARYARLAEELNLGKAELALGFARSRWPECSFVLGAETVDQVRMNAELFDKVRGMHIREDYFQDVPEEIGNPLLWPEA